MMNNSAITTDGGGMAAYASDWDTNTTITMENNLIARNEGAYGGGLFFFAHNGYTAPTGPNHHQSFINVTLSNNIVAYNHGVQAFGALVFYTGGNGTGVFSVQNNDVVYNWADLMHNGGIFISSGGGYTGTPIENDYATLQCILKNNILWGNHGNAGENNIDIYSYKSTAPASVNVSYCIIGSYTNYQGDLRFQNCLNTDPEFVDPSNLNFAFQEGSPAIDAGDVSAQLNDAQRPPGKGTFRGDLGCYGGPLNYQWLL